LSLQFRGLLTEGIEEFIPRIPYIFSSRESGGEVGVF